MLKICRNDKNGMFARTKPACRFSCHMYNFFRKLAALSVFLPTTWYSCSRISLLQLAKCYSYVGNFLKFRPSCMFPIRFRNVFCESSLSVFQRRADCLRIVIPTGQVSSLRPMQCIVSVIEVILLLFPLAENIQQTCTPGYVQPTCFSMRRTLIASIGGVL